MKGAALASLSIVAISNLSLTTKEESPQVSDQDVTSAYHYMLGRWAALRQEAADMKAGYQWNKLVHHAAGEASWANPQSSVLYSEAWIYVDAMSCSILNLPEIKGRYYNVTVVNGWGDVTATINARSYPQHPYGQFALCLRGKRTPIAAGVQRVGVTGKKSRMLVSIESGGTQKEALALQKRITLRTTGVPKVAPIPAAFDFANSELPGVEAFDRTEDILASEPDSGKDSQILQDKVRAVASAAADANQRGRIDAVIREEAIPGFFAALRNLGSTTNGWFYPRTASASDAAYLVRSAVGLGGLWAGYGNQAIYFGASELQGNQIYTQTFPKDAPPIKNARYRWSIAVLDRETLRTLSTTEIKLRRGELSDARTGFKFNADGSLTLAFAAQRPSNIPPSNWIATPSDKNYSLAYRVASTAPDSPAEYYPPALVTASLK